LRLRQKIANTEAAMVKTPATINNTLAFDRKSESTAEPATAPPPRKSAAVPVPPAKAWPRLQKIVPQNCVFKSEQCDWLKRDYASLRKTALVIAAALKPPSATRLEVSTVKYPLICMWDHKVSLELHRPWL
jgi:hypothetical protein